MGDSEEHQRLRELLGSYALGHLGDGDTARVRAHLDGCARCRADLAEIAPLRDLLATVDADRFALPALPPADLGDAIRSQVAGERSLQESDDLTRRRVLARRRTSARVALGTVAATVALLVLIGGFAIGRTTAPETAAPPPVPVEPVELVVDEAGIDIESSGLVAHTWGVELRMTGTGFDEGEVFQAAFRDRETGELVTAGAFLGTGRDPMVCNLQSALLRTQTDEVVVTDSSGDVVLTAPL
jgi:hypothetical protein